MQVLKTIQTRNAKPYIYIFFCSTTTKWVKYLQYIWTAETTGIILTNVSSTQSFVGSHR